MTYPLFEIKLLAALDHAQFEEAIWAFEIDGDISTLLLIDYALEQFHQKKVQADEVYRVPEQKIKKIGEQNLGLEKNESYTFAELLQFLIFTQANDVKDALSNMLFGSIEQTQLILSKRAEDLEITFETKHYAIFNGYWHRDTAYLDYDFYALGSRNGVACLNGVLLEQIMRYKQAHPERKIIVICHWGVDFKPITKDQTKLATILTQAGADLIVGHGAHTIQPIQIINQKPVVFNIGNAVFNSDGEYEQQNALPFGCIARLDLAKDIIRLYPIYTNNLQTFWQPYPVDAEDFSKASIYMTSLLTAESYMASQDKLGRYLEVKF